MMEGSIQPLTVDAAAAGAAIPTAATTGTAITISTATTAATDTPIPAIDPAATTPSSTATTAAATPSITPLSTAATAATDTPIPAVDAAATTDTPSSTAATAAPTPSIISISAATTAATGNPIPAVGEAATTDTATTAPAVDAAATAASPLYPAWVLLEKEAYYNDRENGTTAEAKTITGHAVKVTFFLADPPAVSTFSVHGPKLEQEDFLVVPRVVFSDKDFILLRFAFTPRLLSTVREPNPVQYFVYKARHGNPLLTPIPTSHRPNNTTSHPSILPDENGNFLVADLAMTSNMGHYVLHVFSSKTDEWTTRPLQLQASSATTEDLPSLFHKVIALGAGSIGWIDLWRGILVCNVSDPDPVLQFIPLPKPEFNMHLQGDPQQIRDVTCCNGFIKFIEMEHYARPASFYSNNKRNCKTTKDFDSGDVLYDSDLFFHSLVGLENPSTLPVTWKIRAGYRHTSWNFWCKWHSFHVDDILVKKPSYYMMLPELWDDNAGKFTLRNLTAVCPTLSIHGGDVVYLVTKVGIHDKEAWVVGVDLRKRTVEVLEPYCAARSSLHQTPFLACTFSGYLNTTPRSFGPEDACGQNYPLNGYLRPGNIIQNNPNMQVVGSYSRSSVQPGNNVHLVNSSQFQPQLVVLPSGSGYVRPVSAQSTYSVLNTDEHARLCLLTPKDSQFQQQMPQGPAPPSVPFNTLMPRMPMDGRFRSQMSPLPASPSMPFNTLMPRMPMDGRFLSQMPPLPAYPALPFDRSMHVWMRAPASVPFNEPEPVLPTATASDTLVNSN